MLDSATTFINQEFYAEHVSPDQLDQLLSMGWRHFGSHFFRYSYGLYEFDVRLVLPLRIRLNKFSLSKSQRRVLKKNLDLDTVVRPIEITTETEDLFDKHKTRFKHGVPGSIYDFLSRSPANLPCDGFEIAIYDDGKLAAVSYFDVAAVSCSGIYAMFDPARADRSLGIFTMLREIEFARENNKVFYYQGYAYEGNSFYDYKKNFRGTETFDWAGNWVRCK